MNEQPAPPDEPWYADGLAFECTRCGKCCTGEPGYVWVTDDELAAIAAFLREPVGEVRAVHTRRTRGRVTLRERANGDCNFWDAKKGCTIYPVRPPQCRTWPFWDSNVATPEEWEHTRDVCPGAGQGDVIPVEEISRRLKVIKM
ncbi:YkgJ family cysteine cluster protein [Gemmata sp.]|uniref:YkgJ family cysteine cluster protein n=1 Tax=Gemmata sp. TaxID=1914242 RepID=UPI003F712E1D